MLYCVCRSLSRVFHMLICVPYTDLVWLFSLNNVLPVDGSVWPKHVGRKHRLHIIYIYINEIFKHFNEYFSELNVD
jgi:hypothetical protein